MFCWLWIHLGCMKHFLRVCGESYLALLPHCVLVPAVCLMETLLSLGVDVGALPFIPWSAGVCGFLTSNVIGTYLVQTEPHVIQLKRP